MEGRSFTTLGELCHKDWLGNILGMGWDAGKGIDFSDDEVGIELKCRYQKYYHSWTVHYYQIDYFRQEYPDQELFWAFLLYDLNKEVKEIENNINKEVAWREVYFLEWDWVRQFKVWNPKTGPYVYVHQKKLPLKEEFQEFKESGGVLYIPKNAASLESKLEILF